MKRGFTLIELLAVLIILGILALIATPIIFGIIRDTKEQSKEKSIELYIRAAELAATRNKLTKNAFPRECIVSSGVCMCDDDTEPLPVDMNNASNINGTITFNEYGVVESYDLSAEPIESVSFAEDSWKTISLLVKSGTYPYQVGDTKEIDMGDFGIHTVRISNTTPCDGTLASETACGFVLEFADVITDSNENGHAMNSTATNIGGWPASEMRAYVNTDIYNALPEGLRNAIIDTTVVSGHGSEDSNNFTSTDKLYLLSTKEVWNGGKGKDTAEAETRQLDYYANNGVTTENFISSTIKYKFNTSSSSWWLRSASNENSVSFFIVPMMGAIPFPPSANTINGVSPAFRIG